MDEVGIDRWYFRSFYCNDVAIWWMIVLLFLIVWYYYLFEEIDIFIRVVHVVDGIIRRSYVCCLIVDIVNGSGRVVLICVRHEHVCRYGILKYLFLVIGSLM